MRKCRSVTRLWRSVPGVHAITVKVMKRIINDGHVTQVNRVISCPPHLYGENIWIQTSLTFSTAPYDTDSHEECYRVEELGLLSRQKQSELKHTHHADL